MQRETNEQLTQCVDPAPADVPAILADITALIMDAIRRGYGVITVTINPNAVQVEDTRRRRYERGPKRGPIDKP